MRPLTEVNDLASLKHHWGSAYVIISVNTESWTALRRDGKGQIHADSPDALLYGMRADYQIAPVPRQADPEE